MRLLLGVACLLNVALADDTIDEVIRGLEESGRRYDEDMRRLKRDKVDLPDWAKPEYQAERRRQQQMDYDRLQDETYRFQMLDQMERLNKNLESRHR